jgi:hypothetical protein
MKTMKILTVFVAGALLFTSCSTEVIVDDYYEEPGISLYQLLDSYELWYVDINRTVGYGETPFLQIAFTLSFRGGTLYANNNLVGFGSQGNGFGVSIGSYDAYDMILDVNHIIDGYETFDVYQIDGNTIELYNPNNDTSYFLDGYQRSNFDYDLIFYDNIHYFLQEYEAWEKTYTSEMGTINEFDYENYLQFLPGGNDSTFRSSQDEDVVDIDTIVWDYTGIYGVQNVQGDDYLKTLTLDYDFFDNEYFELNVINDGLIELYHPSSETIYEFKGRGYIPFYRTSTAKGEVSKSTEPKKRKQRTDKIDNPRENTRN